MFSAPFWKYELDHIWQINR